MGQMGERSGRKAAVIAWLLLSASMAWAAAAQSPIQKASSPTAAVAADEPAPAGRIPVAPLGFVAPSPNYLSTRQSFATLNFIDSDHLLFTFHVNTLLERIPGDPPDDSDQLIRAMVLEIKTGKVLQQADWRMHDRGQYLWALRDGTFLVRVRNSLFLTDRGLELRPYLKFDTDLEGVEVSPGRGLLMLEVKKYLPAKKGAAEENGDSSLPPSLIAPEGVRRFRTEMALIRPGEREVLGEAEFLNPANVPLLENGILNVDEGKKPKDWVIKREMLGKTTAVIGTVKSSCAPQLVALSADVVLAQNCPVKGESGKAVSALSIHGQVLWHDLWESRYVWPKFESSEDGSRFAYESLETSRPMAGFDSPDGENVVSQPVGVFDTKTGKLALVKDASPILSAGQNFALSADGRRFAILRKGAIEVYDLPAVVAKDSGAGPKK
jgi:hypothetical protein